MQSGGDEDDMAPMDAVYPDPAVFAEGVQERLEAAMAAVAKAGDDGESRRGGLSRLKHTPPAERASSDDEGSQAKRRRLLSPYTMQMVELDDACVDDFSRLGVAEAKSEDRRSSSGPQLPARSPGRSPIPSPMRSPMRSSGHTPVGSPLAQTEKGGDHASDADHDEAKLDFDIHAPRNVNSTSSIFASSTLAQPDTDQIIFCMSVVLQIQMSHDVHAPPELRQHFRLFEQPGEHGDVETALPPLPNVAGRVGPDANVPHVDEIYYLISSIFHRAQFSAECNIIALIYINRVIYHTHLPLHRGNWRPVVLAAIILAQKVWDDKSLTTSTFTKIIPAYSRRQVRLFESSFLELLEYKATVTQAVYAKYYFELRSLFEKIVGTQTEFPLRPAAHWRLKKLELRSKSFKMQRAPGPRRRARDRSDTPDSGAGNHVSLDFADTATSARRVLS